MDKWDDTLSSLYVMEEINKRRFWCRIYQPKVPTGGTNATKQGVYFSWEALQSGGFSNKSTELFGCSLVPTQYVGTKCRWKLKPWKGENKKLSRYNTRCKISLKNNWFHWPLHLELIRVKLPWCHAAVAGTAALCHGRIYKIAGQEWTQANSVIYQCGYEYSQPHAGHRNLITLVILSDAHVFIHTHTNTVY